MVKVGEVGELGYAYKESFLFELIHPFGLQAFLLFHNSNVIHAHKMLSPYDLHLLLHTAHSLHNSTWKYHSLICIVPQAECLLVWNSHLPLLPDHLTISSSWYLGNLGSDKVFLITLKLDSVLAMSDSRIAWKQEGAWCRSLPPWFFSLEEEKKLGLTLRNPLSFLSAALPITRPLKMHRNNFKHLSRTYQRALKQS